jgi:hypothetical protein
LHSLRAAVSLHQGEESYGLAEYIQTTFSLGSVMILDDTIKLSRCVLVNSTYSSPRHNPSLDHRDFGITPEERYQELVAKEQPFGDDKIRENSVEKFNPFSSEETMQNLSDQPRRRKMYRIYHVALRYLMLVSMVTGIVGNCLLLEDKDDPAKTLRNQALRYVRLLAR